MLSSHQHEERIVHQRQRQALLVNLGEVRCEAHGALKVGDLALQVAA